jgi:Ala-tRNA(Pro) deacylase
MAIASTVVDYLRRHAIPYAVVPHPRTITSREAASCAHVPANRLAKAVVFAADGGGYVMAVIPSDRHVGVQTLSRKLGRHLELVSEVRLKPVFKDCDPGAIPPLGPAYGMETILDDSLVGQPEIFFEAGDHEELIRVGGEEFVRLLAEARHGQFSH